MGPIYSLTAHPLLTVPSATARGLGPPPASGEGGSSWGDARRFVQYCLLQDARSSGDLDEVEDVQVGDMGQQWTM